MTPEEGVLTLAGRRQDVPIGPELSARVEAARTAVARRKPMIDEGVVVATSPSELNSYTSKLREDSVAARYLNQGWQIAVADLRRVCAMQPTICVDHALERVSGADGADLPALAAVTLPMGKAVVLPAQFDTSRNAWIFSSQNPNLRVAGNFNAPLQPGLIGFGFVVVEDGSFMQVVRYGGRCFLRDGYHRALGFVMKGITHVPVLYREAHRVEEVIVPGLLPQDAYRGPRPPTIADYLDDEVSDDVTLPAIRKMVVIQALELATLG